VILKDGAAIKRPTFVFANSDDVFVGGAYLVAENDSFAVAVCGSHGIKE